MKIVIATNPFKGSISSVRAGEVISAALLDSIPKVKTDAVPIADGGDGTLDCIAASVPSEKVKKKVPDPLGRMRDSGYLLIDGGQAAVIEMASASGLAMLKDAERDTTNATAIGTGLLIRDAVARSVKRILIGIGGSATTEGGMSAAVAMGYIFLDSKGNELAPCGASLSKVAKIDTSAVMPGLSRLRITVACDVTAPLAGPSGAAYVYAKQKGATPAQIKNLDSGLMHLADIAARDLGKDLRNHPGAGAAGGMGFGLMTFLGAKLMSGIDMMMDITKLEKRLAGADFLVTGEGRMDSQSVQGKAPFGLLKLAKKMKVPVIAFCGSVQEEESLYKEGFTSVFPIVTGPMSLDEAMESSEKLLYLAALRAGRLIRASSAK